MSTTELFSITELKNKTKTGRAFPRRTQTPKVEDKEIITITSQALPSTTTAVQEDGNKVIMEGVDIRAKTQYQNPDGSITSDTKEFKVISNNSATVPPVSGVWAYTWEFWIYFVIAVVTIIVVWWIGGMTDSRNYYASLQKVSWADNISLIAVLMTIVVLLNAYASFLAGFITRSPTAKAMVYTTFALQSILLIIFSAIFYKQQSLSSSFYISILLVLVTVWQGWTFYYCGSPASFYLLILYFVWLLAVVYISWNVWSLNA